LHKPLPGSIILLAGGQSFQHKAFVIADGRARFSLTMAADSFPAWLEVKALSWKPFRKLLTADMIGDSLIISLEPDTATLEPVEIRAKQPVQVRGDTTVFDVKAFASGAEQQLSDLLKRLPGFELDRQGNIRFKGKPVQRVLLNGADLAGADYQQLIQRLSARGVEEVMAIENYTDDDDELAALAGLQQLAVNFKYADSVAAQVQGRLSALLGMPGRRTEAEAQALRLGSSTKWLGIAGYSTGTQHANAGALGSAASASNASQWTSGRAEPLIQQWPEPGPVANVAMLTQPAAGYGQVSLVGGNSTGWRWRSQTQWLLDRASQQTSETNQILLRDTTVTQTSSSLQRWHQERLSATWRGSRRMPGGNQIILEANLTRRSLESGSDFRFLQVAGLDAQHQQVWEGQTRIVLNRKRDTAVSHRTELLVGGQWIADKFQVVSPAIVKDILNSSIHDSTLAQRQSWQGWRAEVKHRVLLPKASRWRIEGRAGWLYRRQQLDWSATAATLTLATGHHTTAQAELQVGYSLWAKGYNRLTAQLLAQGGQLQQDAAIGHQHIPFRLLLPSLMGQLKWKGWNLNANLGWQNAVAEWPFTLPGSALAGRTTLQQGAPALAPRAAFGGNATLNRLQITGRRPSLLVLIFHQQRPLFLLPDFSPGASLNKVQFIPFHGHRSITTANIRVASPLARQKLAYEVSYQLTVLASYNRPLGRVQKFSTAMQQVKTKLVWRPDDQFRATITNTVGLQRQQVAGSKGGQALTNLTEAGVEWQIGKKLQFDVAGGYFLNRTKNSATDMFFCTGQAVMKLGKWSLLSQVYNPLNVSSFTTVRVGSGQTTISEVSLLSRYIALGVRYAW
jgi:hypothetical protein